MMELSKERLLEKAIYRYFRNHGSTAQMPDLGRCYKYEPAYVVELGNEDGVLAYFLYQMNGAMIELSPTQKGGK